MKENKFNSSNFKNSIDNFLLMVHQVRRLAPATLKAYKNDLKWLNKRVSSDSKIDESFKIDDPTIFRSYVVLMKKETRLSSRTISRRISTWRIFFDWLCEQSEESAEINLDFNPLRSLRPPRSGQLLPKALSVDDAVKFVSSFKSEGKKWIAIRDKSIFELIYSSGLRVSEVVNLDIIRGKSAKGWIDYEGLAIEILGKRDRWRRVPIGKQAIFALKNWLILRRNLIESKKIKNSQNALFVNKNGGRLSSRGIQRRFQIHSKDANNGQPVHPHMLRHSFASHILQSSGDLRAVQEMLGHSKISSTQIYTKLDFQHLSKTYDQHHPRAFSKEKTDSGSD